MRTFFPLLMASLIAAMSSYGQTSFPTGVYMSYKELMSRTPLQFGDFDVFVNDTSGWKLYNGGEGGEVVLKSADGRFQRNHIRKKVFGVSVDGRMYINLYHHLQLKGYSEVLYDKEFLLFGGPMTDVEAAAHRRHRDFGLIGMYIDVMGMPNPWYLYILDDKFSVAKRLTTGRVKEILAEQPLLTQLYGHEEDLYSVETILRYLKLLDEMNAEAR